MQDHKPGASPGIKPKFKTGISSVSVLICLVCWQLSGIAKEAFDAIADFSTYDPDVAALLAEYHADSDSEGSLLPTVMAYQGASRAETLVDFERGLISISASNPDSVQQAAVEILLTQIDPSIIDAQTAVDLGLINTRTEKPFFFQQVLDQDQQPIASVWRANRFAEYLMNRQNAGNRLIIPMVGKHKQIAGGKYLNFVKIASKQHMIPIPLIMAIIETESAFNPVARSRSNALGLMQIKANTAGRDYFSIIKGYQHTPTTAFLYNPSNNVEVGTGYLSILADRYLAGIYHPKKLQYAIISSYNGGAGNLYKSLAPNGGKQAAIDRINSMTVEELYWFLTNRHIRGETRNYLKKVASRMPKYENL